MSDLSGLREERRASVAPSDPKLCFMACCRSLSVWEKTGRPEELRSCLCVCVSVRLHTCLVCVQFLPLKQSRGQRLVCLESVCVCVYVCVCVCVRSAAVEPDKDYKHNLTAGEQVHLHLMIRQNFDPSQV